VDLETSCLPFGVEVDVMEEALLDDKDEETAERLRGFLRGRGSYCKPRRDFMRWGKRNSRKRTRRGMEPSVEDEL
jgi:hypothetical protein